MVTFGDIRNNIDIQSDYAVVYYDNTDDERYNLNGLEGHKLSDFDDCDVQYIYYDSVDRVKCIVFELREEDVLEVLG